MTYIQTIYSFASQTPLFTLSTPMLLTTIGIITLTYLSAQEKEGQVPRKWIVITSLMALIIPKLTLCILTLIAIYNHLPRTESRTRDIPQSPNKQTKSALPFGGKILKLSIPPLPKADLNPPKLDFIYGDIEKAFKKIAPKENIGVQVAAHPTQFLGNWSSGQAAGAARLVGIRDNPSSSGYHLGLTDVMQTEHTKEDVTINLYHIAAPNFTGDTRISDPKAYKNDESIKEWIYSTTLKTLIASKDLEAIILTPAGTAIFLGKRKTISDNMFDPYIEGLLQAVDQFKKQYPTSKATIYLNLFKKNSGYQTRFEQIAKNPLSSSL